MRRRLIVQLTVLLALSFGGLLASVVAGNTPALGLDLQGGISVTQQPVGEFEPETLDLAVERIRERVDGLGVAEPEILRQGDAIVVNLPGVKNQQEAIDLVQVTGQVYLRPVVGCAGEGVEETPTSSVPGSSVVSDEAPTTTAAPGPSRRVASTPTTEAATDTTTADTTTADTTTADTTTADTTTAVPVDAPLTTVSQSDPNTQQVLPLQGGGVCQVGAATTPSGRQATGAVFENDALAQIINGGWGVTVGLRDGFDGEDLWNELALECVQQGSTCPSGRLAIELDGLIVSAPSVNEANFVNNVQITGSFEENEARDLARVLKSGSLPVRMETQSVQNVSPTLGQDSLDAALIAGFIGVALVLLLLVVYYRLLGLVVVGGVVVSGAILYTVISFLSQTQGLALSLSGAAGVIVSVGVTVDSYVVYFERLKDEIRNGRTMRNSAQRGFTDAWRTILMADIVSFIGAFTLWWLTVGSVRNFAFFLGLSTIIDLIVSYFFTRPVVLLLARTKWMARTGVMGVKPVSSGVTVAGSPS